MIYFLISLINSSFSILKYRLVLFRLFSKHFLFLATGCIELKGPLQQQIKQLRARERELLTEVDRLEVTVKKLKDDRAHYRKMTDDFR